jgi:hypothetical protein
MNIIQLMKAYQDEESCRLKFKPVRDKAGVICKSCGSNEHYWLKSKSMYQCKCCRFRTSLRSGTIMVYRNAFNEFDQEKLFYI